MLAQNSVTKVDLHSREFMATVFQINIGSIYDLLENRETSLSRQQEQKDAIKVEAFFFYRIIIV